VSSVKTLVGSRSYSGGILFRVLNNNLPMTERLAVTFMTELRHCCHSSLSRPSTIKNILPVLHRLFPASSHHFRDTFEEWDVREKKPRAAVLFLSIVCLLN
jgi:hypothetical protein